MAQSADVRAELTAESKRVIEKAIKFNAMPTLRRELTAATQPLAPAVKRVVRSLPSSRKRVGEKGGSLRSAVANAVTRKIKLSRRSMLILVTSIPHGGKSNLARAFEGEIPWRHPVFGHEPTVDQESHPFFYKTLKKYEPIIAARVKAALDKVERKL